MKSNIKIEGFYTIRYKPMYGEDTIEIRNMIVDSGLNAIADKLGDVDSSSIIQYFALGTGNTAVAAGDILLDTEVFRKSPDTINVVNNVITAEVQLGFDEGNGFTFREVSIFGVDGNGAVDTGTLISRALVSPTISKVSGQLLDITWTLTITRV